MRYLLNLAHYSGAIMVCAATVPAAISASRVWRRGGDRHRFDVVWPLAALAYLEHRPGARWPLMYLALQVLQPYLLLRLISHVRDVPRVLSATALGVAAAAVGAAIVLPTVESAAAPSAVRRRSPRCWRTAPSHWRWKRGARAASPSRA